MLLVARVVFDADERHQVRSTTRQHMRIVARDTPLENVGRHPLPIPVIGAASVRVTG
jgi:hypothetical protein